MHFWTKCPRKLRTPVGNLTRARPFKLSLAVSALSPKRRKNPPCTTRLTSPGSWLGCPGSAPELFEIGRRCFLGHYTLILDNNEHDLRQHRMLIVHAV
jgi:hypothetical protein